MSIPVPSDVPRSEANSGRAPWCPLPSEPGLVSIVMPAYRADRFIAGAIDGIRRQRYALWELIVVEDASEGDTCRAVEAFAREASERRIIYLRHEQNRGPNAARNSAIVEARGEYLAFLDADDLWLESHLSASIDTLVRQKADIAYSTVAKFEDETNRPLGDWGPTPRELSQFPTSLAGRNFITPSTTVLRRRVVEAVGPFDEGLRACEDLDYWFRCVEAGQSFAHVPGCHCRYRKGGAGAGSGDPRKIIEHQVLVLRRHFGNAGISVKAWSRALAYYQMAAGVLYLESDSRRAATLFRDAWHVRPMRMDLLMLAILSATVFRVVSLAPFVRWLKRRRGYAV